jgi:hypothetical protein
MTPVVSVVLPVFAIILSGYLTGRFRLLGDGSSEALNGFVYYVALPVLFFSSMAKVEPEAIFNWPFIAAYGGGQLITLTFAMLLARLVFKNRLAESSLFGMAAIFGNTGYMGIPLAIVAFGNPGAFPAILATIFKSSVIIALITVLVEIDLSRSGRVLDVGRDAALAVVKNPLVTSSALGIAWSFTGLGLAPPVDTFCGILGAAAGPCALFAIGLFLVGKPLRQDLGEVGVALGFKLVVHPLVTGWLAFKVFAVEPLWATVAVVMAALPAGANCFVIASRYGVYVQRASSAILLSTVAAVVTVSILFSVWVPSP